jgi:hypothetical protein
MAPGPDRKEGVWKSPSWRAWLKHLFCESQSVVFVTPCTELMVTQSVHDNSIKSSPRSLWQFFRSSDIMKRCFPRMHCRFFWTSSPVTIECCLWLPLSCTSMLPSLNFLHHSLTQLSLITLSTYTRHHWWWISAAHCPSAWRKRIRGWFWNCPRILKRCCVPLNYQQENNATHEVELLKIPAKRNLK